MDNMIRIDKDYVEWLKHVKKRFKNTQIKASIKVNDELLSQLFQDRFLHVRHQERYRFWRKPHVWKMSVQLMHAQVRKHL